jgi:hypothetical protein
VIFHLGSGKSVTALWESDDEDDQDEALDALDLEIGGKLAGKPSWFNLGDTWVFTGAVSAIEIDY